MSQVRELKTTVSCHNSRFSSSSACRDSLFTGLGLYSNLAVGPTFKLRLRTAEVSMTVKPVADVAFAHCQGFYKGIRLLSLLQCRDSDPCKLGVTRFVF